jgi:ABC-type uncharacterized transport system substrate-binding protein
MNFGRKLLGILLGLLLLPAWGNAAKPKILFVNSYHAEYEWSAGIIEGVFDEMGITRSADGVYDFRQCPVELEFFHMDTKRHPEESFAEAAALAAHKRIEAWNPDVVIVADDNAFKSLVVPYYKNSERPFVFCGVNWDVAHYDGAPFDNTTGMVEISLLLPLIEHLQKYAQGPRIGFLSGNRYSDRVEAEYGRSALNIQFEKEYYVDSFAEWKKAFRTLQDEVDLFIWTAVGGIEDWDERAAKKWIYQKARVPFGTVNDWMMPYELIGLTKVPQEQGSWAVQTALKILNGTPPKEIPLQANKKAKIYLNMILAKQMGIKFPVEWIENAHLISASPKKVLYVDSYHQGYPWSDKLEIGLRKALGSRNHADGSFEEGQGAVDLRVCRLNSKRERSPEQIERGVLQARKMIEEWQPDVVVTSDDCAAKFLLQPYYLGSELPIVFCGLNGDAAEYGFPTNNITGMMEKAPYKATLERLSLYAKGERVGIIGAQGLSNQKEAAHAKAKLGLRDEDIKLVASFDEWKAAYLDLQKRVDMVIMLNSYCIDGWDSDKAKVFVMDHTTKPTGTVSDTNVGFALLGEVKIAEEQGWWAGRAALRILGGTAPSEIPLVTNKHSKLYLNMELAKRMDIRFPINWIQQAIFVEE